jgi:hypothetical protein
MNLWPTAVRLRAQRAVAPVLDERDLGFGHIVTSHREVPNMIANLV